jgi:adenosine deaminase
MAKTIPLEVIQKLPKTDLHVHLDGSLRLGTILDLAQKQRVELPANDEDGLRKAMNLGQNCGTLVEYLKAFDVTLRVPPTNSPKTPRTRTFAIWKCGMRRCFTPVVA